MTEYPLIPGRALPRDTGPGLHPLLSLVNEAGTVSVWQLGELADALRRWMPGGQACQVGGSRDAAWLLILATSLRMTLLQLFRVSGNLVPVDEETEPDRYQTLIQVRSLLARLGESLHRQALRAISAEVEPPSEESYQLRLVRELRQVLEADPDLRDHRANVVLPHNFPTEQDRAATFSHYMEREEVWWAMIGHALADLMALTRSIQISTHQLLRIPAWLSLLPASRQADSPWPIQNIAAAIQAIMPFRPTWEHGYQFNTGVVHNWFVRGSRDARRVARMRAAVVGFDVDRTIEGGHDWQQFKVQLEDRLYRQIMDIEALELQQLVGYRPWTDHNHDRYPYWLRAAEPLVLAAGLQWNNSSSGATYSDEDTVPMGVEMPEPDNPRWLFTWNQTLVEPPDYDEISPEDMPDAREPWDR